MMQWALVKLKAFGAEVELCDIGQQVLLKFNTLKKKIVPNMSIKIFINEYVLLKNVVLQK